MVFGRVLKGADVVRLIENEKGDDSNNRPFRECKIVDCGELKEGEDDGVVVDPSDPYPAFPSDQDDRSIPSLLSISLKLRELGNTLFKQQQWEAARAKYDKSIRYTEVEDFPSPEETKELEAARLPSLLNRAACQLKLGRWSEARVDCEAALKIDPENGKGRMRLGQALIGLKDEEEGVKELERAAKALVGDKSLTALLAQTKKKIAEDKKRQAQVWSKMFA